MGFKNLLLQFARDTQGQDLLEWALLVGFVAAAGGATIPGVGTEIAFVLCRVQFILFQAGGTLDAGCTG